MAATTITDRNGNVLRYRVERLEEGQSALEDHKADKDDVVRIAKGLEGLRASVNRLMFSIIAGCISLVVAIFATGGHVS